VSIKDICLFALSFLSFLDSYLFENHIELIPESIRVHLPPPSSFEKGGLSLPWRFKENSSVKLCISTPARVGYNNFTLIPRTVIFKDLLVQLKLKWLFYQTLANAWIRYSLLVMQ